MNEVPDDLAAALKAAGLDDFFQGCTNAHRREYEKWIGEAKRPETRRKRIEKTVAMLSAKLSGEEKRKRETRRSGATETG